MEINTCFISFLFSIKVTSGTFIPLIYIFTLYIINNVHLKNENPNALVFFSLIRDYSGSGE